MKKNVKDFARYFIGIYILWFTFHFILFVVADYNTITFLFSVLLPFLIMILFIPLLNWISIKWRIVYLIWFVTQGLLLLFSKGGIILSKNIHTSTISIEGFFPFNAWGDFEFNVAYYDSSEFIIYTLVPILILLAINFLRPTNKNNWNLFTFTKGESLSSC